MEPWELEDWEFDDLLEWEAFEVQQDFLNEVTFLLADRFFLSDNNYYPNTEEEYDLGHLRPEAWWSLVNQLDDLVDLARSAPESTHRVWALRGAIRLSSMVEGRTPEQLTSLVGELWQLAREPAERQAMLTELGRCPTREALLLARQALGQPELASEAGWTVTRIADAVRETHRAEAISALLCRHPPEV